MPDRVTSDVYGPVIGGVYVLMLPVWALLFLGTLASTGGNRTFLAVLAGLVTLASVAIFLKGLTLFRQHVEADADGLRLAGPGGFRLPWDAVAELKTTASPRSGNVAIRVQGTKIPTDYVLGRSATRRFGVEPAQVEALRALAEAHGVHVPPLG